LRSVGAQAQAEAAKACKNLAFLRSVSAQAQAEGAKAYKKIDK